MSLNEIVREITAELQPVFETARIRFRLQLDEGLPAVALDPKLFPSVLYNLLENAFKFSRRFQSITVTTARDAEHAVLEVSDNGIGIPEDQWKVVFLKHYRASNNEEPGHGLGLYIVKRIVEAHRGEVFVAKRSGVKTTLVVRIPLVAQALTAAAHFHSSRA
jgi:signal transduction histidine kinase